MRRWETDVREAIACAALSGSGGKRDGQPLAREPTTGCISSKERDQHDMQQRRGTTAACRLRLWSQSRTKIHSDKPHREAKRQIQFPRHVVASITGGSSSSLEVFYKMFLTHYYSSKVHRLPQEYSEKPLSIQLTRGSSQNTSLESS